MTAGSSSHRDGETVPARPGDRLGAAALGIILVCLAARPMLSEMPFDMWAVKTVSDAEGAPALRARAPNPGHLVRVVIACALLSAGGLWALGRARAGAVEIRHRWLGVLIAVFAAWSLISTFRAADQRAAWTSWLEQVSLLVACFTAAQICRRKRARDLLLAAAAAACLVLVARSAWQMAFEFPANHSQLAEDRDATLRKAGYDPDSPNAAMLEKRMLADTPYGFMSLSNPFGSMMIVLGFAAAAVAVERFAAAGASRPPAGTVPRGELHLPTLAAILTSALAAAAVVVVLLTRSRGAIAAMIVAATGAVGVYRTRRALGRHWRRALLIAAVAVAVVAGAVAGYGLAHDRLPTRTMTFRWYYWTGSGGIIAEKPAFGTGGGNFPNAYLRHRRPAAEEAVKTPHNVVVGALVQYGIPGGMCLVAAMCYVLAASARPGRETTDPGMSNAPRRREHSSRLAGEQRSPFVVRTKNGERCSPAKRAGNDTLKLNAKRAGSDSLELNAKRAGNDSLELNVKRAGNDALKPNAKRAGNDSLKLNVSLAGISKRSAAPMFGAAAAATLIGRWLFHDPADGGFILMFDVFLPAMVLGGALALSRWHVRCGPGDGTMSPAGRICLVCGLAGFVLHNAVTFSMWVPGAATVFWILGGVCLSQAPAGRAVRLVRWRWRAAGLAAAGAAGAALLFCPPVIRAHRMTRALGERIRAGDLAGAVPYAEAGALADPSSATLAIDAAVVVAHAAAKTPSRDQSEVLAARAHSWAARAVGRDPMNPEAHAVAGSILFHRGRTGQGWPDAALEHFKRAVELDPMNMRLRLVYASALAEAGRSGVCLAQLREVGRIDGSLARDSAVRLTPRERKHLADLAKLAGARVN